MEHHDRRVGRTASFFVTIVIIIVVEFHAIIVSRSNSP